MNCLWVNTRCTSTINCESDSEDNPLLLEFFLLNFSNWFLIKITRILYVYLNSKIIHGDILYTFFFLTFLMDILMVILKVLEYTFKLLTLIQKC